MKNTLSLSSLFVLCLLIGWPTFGRNGDIDLLVVAPHPDDEVIGCTGVMMEALNQGKRVGVVILTNGDGFPKGAASVTTKAPADLTTGDFLKLGDLRQRQSLSAARHVGLAPEDLTFLSYPDGGLATIYESEHDQVYIQKYTGKSATYELAVRDYHSSKHGKQAPYTKSSVLGDLEEIIRERQPAQIYVTHQIDTHSDHRAAFWFVRDATLAAAYKGSVYTFVVHGDKKPEGPPLRVPLTPHQLLTKRAAIGEHAIPGVHDHLVETHAKEEEIFWPVPIQ